PAPRRFRRSLGPSWAAAAGPPAAWARAWVQVVKEPPWPPEPGRPWERKRGGWGGATRTGGAARDGVLGWERRWGRSSGASSAPECPHPSRRPAHHRSARTRAARPRTAPSRRERAGPRP